MKRREFSKKLVLGGLAGTGLFKGFPAHATLERDEDNDVLEQIARIRLEIGNRVITPNELRILGRGNSVKTINLTRKYPQNNERRIFIRGISKPTIRRRFRGARRSGQVLIDAKVIYVRPDPIEDLNFDRVTVVHRGISWDVGDVKNVVYQPVNKIPNLGGLPVIGELFRQKSGTTKADVMISITPAMVKLP